MSDVTETPDPQTSDAPERSIEDGDAIRFSELERQNVELKAQADEYRDLLQRKQAEFENYRKRTLRERDAIRDTHRIEVLGSLLPVLDAAEKGLQSMQGDARAHLETYQEGYELLVREIQAVLQRFQVEAVPGVGHPFDPNQHEAVLQEETDQTEDGTILEEYRKGYRCGDRLLRASQVKVASNPQPAEPGESGAQAEQLA